MLKTQILLSLYTKIPGKAIQNWTGRGRPLSQSGNLMQMYEKRKPQYEAFADLIIENSSTPQAAANAILEALT